MDYELAEEVQEKVFAEYFATIHDGKIMVLGNAIPPQELVSCQVVLSKDEYDLLKAVRSDLDKAEKIIRSVRAKIKANGS